MKEGNKVQTAYGEGTIKKLFLEEGLAKVNIPGSPITDFRVSELTLIS